MDMDSIEWLENYIKHYPFAVILVSHDRMFLDNVVDEIVEIEFGKSMRYVGNYTHYIKAKEEYLKKIMKLIFVSSRNSTIGNTDR